MLHLGAQIAIPYSYVNPRDFFEINVLGTLNVAQAALRHGVERVVHTSTSEVYGTAQTVPITEDHPLEPQSPYAASKLGADKLMDAWHRSYELPVTILRPFNTYGPRQSARAVIPTIISQALAGGTVRARLAASAPRPHVRRRHRRRLRRRRAVTGRRSAARSSSAPDHDVSIGELVEMVGEVLGRELEVEIDPARVRPEKSEVQRLISDPSLARELLGWEPQVDLREGLARTIEWIERNAARYRVDHYVI